MTPLRREHPNRAYPSSYSIWKDPVAPPIPFIVKVCGACGGMGRRTWGKKLCKCAVTTPEVL
jgi:hypothetical protein